jgi:hypothetical protein
VHQINEVVDMLDVNGCDLDCLPPRMGRLEKLCHLDFSKNKRFVKLPKCMEEMKLFNYLHIHGFDLHCLPQGMG